MTCCGFFHQFRSASQMRRVDVVLCVSSPVRKWLIQSFSGGPCPTLVSPLPSDCPQRTSLNSCCGLKAVDSESSTTKQSLILLISVNAGLLVSFSITLYIYPLIWLAVCIFSTTSTHFMLSTKSWCSASKESRTPGFCSQWDTWWAFCVLHRTVIGPSPQLWRNRDSEEGKSL